MGRWRLVGCLALAGASIGLFGISWRERVGVERFGSCTATRSGTALLTAHHCVPDGARALLLGSDIALLAGSPPNSRQWDGETPLRALVLRNGRERSFAVVLDKFEGDFAVVRSVAPNDLFCRGDSGAALVSCVAADVGVGCGVVGVLSLGRGTDAYGCSKAALFELL